MSDLDIEEATQEDLNAWYTLQDQLTEIKDKEMKLRKKIFKFYFQHPVEGTNTVPLSDGFVMKGTFVINRKPAVELLTTHYDELVQAGVPVGALFKNEPKLVTAAYRLLTDEQRAMVDSVLEISVGSPSLQIVKPKKGE